MSEDSGLGIWANVADVLPTLQNPESYLRKMLHNMMLCKERHGSACVCIGTTGHGIAPHYRVKPEDDYIEKILNDENTEAYFVAYHGRSHKQLAWGSEELKAQHWSGHSTSLDDVRKLLGQVRGYEPKKATNA